MESSRTLMTRFFAWSLVSEIHGQKILCSKRTFLSHGLDVDEDTNMVAWDQQSTRTWVKNESVGNGEYTLSEGRFLLNGNQNKHSLPYII